MNKHVTVAVVGAGMAGQAHAFGYRNATMHPDLADVDVRLATVVDFNEDLARSAAAPLAEAMRGHPFARVPTHGSRSPDGRAWPVVIRR